MDERLAKVVVRILGGGGDGFRVLTSSLFSISLCRFLEVDGA